MDVVVDKQLHTTAPPLSYPVPVSKIRVACDLAGAIKRLAMMFKFLWSAIFSDNPLSVVAVDDVGKATACSAHLAYSIALVEFLVGHDG